MKPYMEQIMLAERWQASVDFGSPMSAWTTKMHDAYTEAKGDLHLATQILNKGN